MKTVSDVMVAMAAWPGMIGPPANEPRPEYPDENRLVVCDDRRQFTVYVRLPTPEKPNGYMAGYVTNREPNPGETWLRGRDLADGPLNRETFDEIARDVAEWQGPPTRSEPDQGAFNGA